MNQPTSTKKSYPVATPEVAKMFGLEGNLEASHGNASQGVNPSGKDGFTQIVGNLFVKQTEAKPTVDLSHVAVASHVEATAPKALPIEAKLHQETAQPQPASGSFGKIANALKTITPYVAVFSVALFVYFYFFSGSGFSFGSLLTTQAKPQSPKENLLTQLEQQNIDAYNKWIGQFYYDVSSSAITDPNSDNSGNGLTNFQKFLLNLNPKSYDTIGLGMADSQALENGINPLSGTPLNDEQTAIVDKYFDFEVISNRLTLATLQKKTQVAGASISANPMTVQTAQAAGYNVAGPEELGASLDIDQTVPGRLEIPSLKIDAPLVFSTDAKNFDKDLQNGVIHYPGTALPGQVGTSYISGHSSNYVWAKGNYNHIFTQLDQLADNTSFTITVKTKDGKTSILHYVVTGRQQYDPKDQSQFENGAKSVVALSTCWPVGSTKYRMVIYGQLTQVEKQ